MTDALALVPSEPRQLPTLPFAWDFEKSVASMKQMVYKMKNLTDEIADELSVARRLTSQRGGKHEGRWGEYCSAIGIHYTTANRWLALRFPNDANASLEPLFSSNSAEWCTPEHVVSRVVSLFGEIDLDPCSNGDALVPATRRFADGDNGLAQQWAGRVYMNPPYGREIGDWVTKLNSAYQAGDVTEAIALVPARTDTEWFQTFRDAAICFVRGRLRFSGYPSGAPFPSAACYLGDRVTEFGAAFGDIGDIWIRVRDDLA